MDVADDMSAAWYHMRQCSYTCSALLPVVLVLILNYDVAHIVEQSMLNV